MGWLFLPLKMIIFIGNIVIFGLTIKFLLLAMRLDANKAYKNKTFNWISNFLLKYQTRMMLLSCGILWIKKRVIKVDPKKYPKLKFLEKKKSKIICSNHASFLDILVLFTQDDCCFISKKSIASYPVMGDIAKALGCLFIDRSS